MAMANNKRKCFTCHRENNTYTCEGCSKRFCLVHLNEHEQKFNEELSHIINDYNEFKERINEQKKNPHNHSLIKQIDQWEIKSIEIIQQKAQDCRQVVIESLQTCINDIEKKFNDLTEQIKHFQKENDFNEINLNHLTNQLIEITQELNNPSNISIQQDSQSVIDDISIILLKTDCWNHRIVEWEYSENKGQIITDGNGKGNSKDQLNQPTDVIVDQQNHSIIIADHGNRRVIQWMNQTQEILIPNIDCYGLAMDKNEFLYVSDVGKNEVRRWKMGDYNNEGIVVAGGNGQGNQLNQLNDPRFIFIDEDQSIYVTDQDNHRVMKWRKDAKEGIVVAGGNGEGGNLNQLYYPHGVIVNDLDRIYVADFGNNRVIRWCEGKEEGEIVVGGNGEENQSNQLNGPCGLSFDGEGNLYVADYSTHQIQKFEIIL
ncbi:unnamed protein product [Adineta steineri]|uniref:Uncharacterized protein n=2 Tax=Adineta steineri TaxID=433720 RepID=A0A813N0R5_9BILA|nr:unnamed protein product [Adineta steineri]CAF3591727.1 unnamed protein product [Adineta steineri]